MKVCPNCHKQVKDLDAHLFRIHKLKPDLSPLDDSTAEHDPEILKVKKPERIPVVVKYHCIDCGHEFEGKPDECPGCHSVLNWEGIQHA